MVDVGTGAGHTAYAFASYVDRVIATDITPEMLRIVEREAKARGLSNVETALMPAEEFDFADGSVQGVTCRVAAHHFQNVVAFLNEVYRVLAPGGWFLLVDTVGIDGDPSADEGLDQIERLRDPSHMRNYTPDRWRAMVEAAGFRIDHFEVVARSHSVEEWLDRMRVEEPTRTRLHRLFLDSTGPLRAYLQPSGEGSTLTFMLHQVFVVARKPL